GPAFSFVGSGQQKRFEIGSIVVGARAHASRARAVLVVAQIRPWISPYVPGRLFDESDTAQTERVAVVSETMARSAWPGTNPIGSRLRLGYPVEGVVRVVGIVEDVKHNKPDSNTEPEVYVSYRQFPIFLMTFVIRTSLDSAALAGSVRSILREELPNTPLGQIATMEHFRSESFRAERFSTFVFTAFAAAALILAAAGLYGLVSYSVATQRR